MTFSFFMELYFTSNYLSYFVFVMHVSFCYDKCSSLTVFSITWQFSLRQFYGPMKNPYSASRTSNLTHGLLLLALILCSLPASVTLVQKSSGVCGPIMKDSSMYQTLSSYIEVLYLDVCELKYIIALLCM